MKRTIALVALSLCAVLALPGVASAATFNVAADFAAIQTAINGASPGDTIQVAAGTATLLPTETITIPNSKLGIKLVGATGAGQTVLQKSSGDQFFIVIGEAPALSPAPAPTVVEWLTLKNSGATSAPRDATNSGRNGIGIRASGVSAADPAIIRNCEFLDLSNAAIDIYESSHRYWEIANNTFDGNRLTIWVNANHFITIRNNVFRRYAVAIGADSVDRITDLTITGNDLLGGAYDPAPIYYRGIQLTSASTVEDEPKNWNISNNYITGATNGILIQTAPSGAQSLTGVVVENNHIVGNNDVTGTQPQTPPYADIKNASAKQLIATNNWWGQASGPDAVQISGLVTTDPYLTSNNEDPALSGGAGFWPAPGTPPVVSTPASSSWSLALMALSAVLVGAWSARRRKELAT
jgi:hypothetical protein